MWAQSVQPFWRLLDTTKQTNKQTDKVYIYRFTGLPTKEETNDDLKLFKYDNQKLNKFLNVAFSQHC